MNKKIVVTGAGGYIGCNLVEILLNLNYEVIAIDRMYFGDDPLQKFLGNPKFKLYKMDSRSIPKEIFEGVYGVCDLVALSNDPTGDINPDLTNQINHLSRVRTAKLAKLAKVERYILWSSCSVYGSGELHNLNEDSPTNPLTAYSKASLAAEVGVTELASTDFIVTILRNGTAFGISRRMRFDLVVNLMVATAFETGKITVTGGGDQWRPLVHVHDIGRVAENILQQPKEIVNKEIFNIGIENSQISTLAYRIREAINISCEILIVPDDSDKRNYHISFNKSLNVLNFKPKVSIEEGALEIYKALTTGKCSRSDSTSTLKWYKRLAEAEQLYKKLNINGSMF
jgi:nucleoside-diphosphate-sugar epimerase